MIKRFFLIFCLAMFAVSATSPVHAWSWGGFKSSVKSHVGKATNAVRDGAREYGGRVRDGAREVGGRVKDGD